MIQQPTLVFILGENQVPYHLGKMQLGKNLLGEKHLGENNVGEKHLGENTYHPQAHLVLC